MSFKKIIAIGKPGGHAEERGHCAGGGGRKERGRRKVIRSRRPVGGHKRH